MWLKVVPSFIKTYAKEKKKILYISNSLFVLLLCLSNDGLADKDSAFIPWLTCTFLDSLGVAGPVIIHVNDRFIPWSFMYCSAFVWVAYTNSGITLALRDGLLPLPTAFYYTAALNWLNSKQIWKIGCFNRLWSVSHCTNGQLLSEDYSSDLRW